MSFDKTKAIRNAERYLSQGKLRAAITEYKQIVQHDPRDIGTLNMLGDLHAKNSEKKEAVECFTQVAEHYGKQGFAQKAIAVYNKISRLQPESLEVSAKLAELYQSKGSFSEARQHYTSLAEQYQKKGMKIEALAIWKQIAQLDPANTQVYLKIAESYWQENQKDDAAESFAEAGFRFSEQNMHEQALAAFSRSLEIKPGDFKALNGFVRSQMNLGYTDDAAETLQKILEQQPNNRDVLYLLVECHLDAGNTAEAEQAVIKLVAQEPANYPKFLDLVKTYLKNNDLDSATRTLSMSAEHLLVGGQAEDFLKWVNEVLARNPEQIDALRLLARYYSWQRDTEAFKQALERLAEVARLNDNAEEERYALSQLVMVAPQEVEYIKRLREVNDQNGFVDETEQPEPIPAQESNEPVSEFETFALVQENSDGPRAAYDFGEYKPSANGNGNGSFHDETLEAEIIEDSYAQDEHKTENPAAQSFSGANLSASDELRLQKEIESITFYVENGYEELAEKSLKALEEEFGQIPELNEITALVRPGAVSKPEPASEPEEEYKGEAVQMEPEVAAAEPEPVVETFEPKTFAEPDISAAPSMGINDLRNELGLEDTESPEGSDYDTHYHMAVAYQEMGLMEEAIKEYQDAINAVAPNDGTRRFFQCAILLGHCFMEKRMPNLALMWLKRAQETPSLIEEEKQGLWYELANAYEADGDEDNAYKYFEQIYAENVDYRDVGARLERLHVNH